VAPTSIPRTGDAASIPHVGRGSDLNDKQSIEWLIKSYGYRPLAKLVVNTDGGKVGKYIKALNPIGIIVFIELDNGGFVTVDKNDLTVTQVVTTDMIPYSVKRCSYESAIPNSRGVAIECNKGVCFVSRDMQGKNNETNYIYSEFIDDSMTSTGQASIVQPFHSSYMTDDGMVSYPIVSLLDIKANPQMVVDHTEVSNRRMLQMAYDSCHNDISAFNESYINMTELSKRFVRLYTHSQEQMNITRDAFSVYAKEHAMIDNRSNADNERYELLLFYLKRRSELQADLVKDCRVMATLSKQLDAISSDLKEIISHLETEFAEVGCIMKR
jgi:hypothetical protein